MIEEAMSIPDNKWEKVELDIPKRKYPTPLVYEHEIPINNMI